MPSTKHGVAGGEGQRIRLPCQGRYAGRYLRPKTGLVLPAQGRHCVCRRFVYATESPRGTHGTMHQSHRDPAGCPCGTVHILFPLTGEGCFPDRNCTRQFDRCQLPGLPAPAGHPQRSQVHSCEKKEPHPHPGSIKTLSLIQTEKAFSGT